MAKYDKYGVRKPEVVYLAKPGQRAYCALNGVDTSTVNVRRQLNNTHELSLEVDKYVNGEKSNGYDLLDIQMLLFVDDIWFKITEVPTEDNDGVRIYKTIMAESLEIELQQYQLVGFKVNRGSVDSIEMMYQEENNLEEFQQVKFHNKETPGLSLLDIILSYADVPGWTVGYIDDITLSEEPDILGNRYLLSDEIASFEIDTQDVYSFLTQDVAKAFSCLFVFNTVTKTINAYREDSLGLDTNIVLGFRNLQNSLSIDSESQIYTIFNVRGEDGLNIDYVNFGSSLIENFSYFMDERFLPKELIAKYNAWQEYMESRRTGYMELSKQYNNLLETIHDLMYRVPTDGASNDWSSMDEDELKTALDDYNALITGLEKLYVDSEGNFDYNALKNSVDWPLYEQIQNYILPSVKAALQKKGFNTEEFGRGNLFQNVNPVLTVNWISLDDKSLTPVQISDDEQPCKGVTRGIQHPGNGGFKQKVSGLSAGETYTFSGYVKCSGNGSVNLECNLIGQDRVVMSTVNVTTGWTRVFSTFTAQSNYYEFSYVFTSGTYTVAGMQLEHGTLHSFGFYSGLANETDTLEAFETDWKLYGTIELKNKQDVYSNNIETLKKDGFNLPHSEGSGYSWDWHSKMHQKYLDYQKLYNECSAALTERTNELTSEETARDKINTERSAVAKDVLKEQFGNVQNEFEGFTEHELSLLRMISIQSDYVNENILTTSISTENEVVDTQYQLYLEAKKQLYVESRPQYTYTDSIDDLYALPEFAEFHDDLNVGNFLYIEISDNYFVKLRVTALEYNPCTWDSGVTVEFSNMTQFEGKRSDWTNLLDDAISSAVGQIVGSSYSSDVTTYTFTPEAIKALLKNPIFGGFIDNVTSNSGNVGNITANNVTADAVITALLKADEAQVGKLTADTAFVTYMESTLISSQKIVTAILKADEATIKNLAAEIIKATSITADIGKINDLLAGNVAAGSGQFINLTADNVKIADAVIKNLIAARISVADLLAGTITLTDEMKIVSENGKMVMDGKVLQMLGIDSNGKEYVGIQLGYDTTDNPSLILRNEDGAIIMSPAGITQDGIADGLIHTNHIGLGQITPDRLSFEVILDENGNPITNIGQIYMGDGQKFGAVFTQMQETYDTKIKDVEDNLDALANKIGEIELTGQQTFIETNDTITPSAITITANCKNNIIPDKWYVDDVENTSYVASDKLSITIPATHMKNRRTTVIKAINTAKNIYDTYTLFKLADGKDGISGQTSYWHIRYSPYENPTDESQITTVPSTYIGVYVDFYPIDSTNPADYTWSRFQGEEGRPGNTGLPGKDGKATYLHVRYSDDGGKTFGENNGYAGGDYMGTYVDYNLADSDNPEMYTWIKTKGDQGIPGKSNFFFVRYSDYTDGHDMYAEPRSTTEYMGVVCVEENIAPTDHKAYTWTKVKGEDGEKGIPGINSFLHIKYSDDGKTFTANNGETIGNYMGTYVDEIEDDSNVFSDYTWKRFVGEDAYTVILSNEAQPIATDYNFVPIVAKSYDCNVVVYRGTTLLSPVTTTPTSGKYRITIANSPKGITVTQNPVGKIIFTTGKTPIPEDGTIDIKIELEGIDKAVTKSISYAANRTGAQGEGALNVVLGNDSQSIPCDTSLHVAGDFEIEIPFYGYKGTKRVGTIAVIEGLPAGFTTIQNDASTTTLPGLIKLKVATGTDLNTTNRNIPIKFTLDAENFEKVFTWSCAEPGADGQPARLYYLDTSSLVIKKATSGTFEPANVTFSSYYRDGSATGRLPCPCRFKIEEFIGATSKIKYTSSVDETSKSWTPSSTDVTRILCTILSADGNVLDSQSVVTLVDMEGIDEELKEIHNTITQVQSTVDANALEIKNKISKTDTYTVTDKDGNQVNKTIHDILVQSTQDITGFTNTVSDIKSEIGDKNNPADGTLRSQITTAQQTANKFDWLVKNGGTSTSFQLTDTFAKLVSGTFTIDAIVEIFNTAKDNGATIIDGGLIKTGTITSDLITTDGIQSRTYAYTSGNYSTSGIKFSLLNKGYIRAQNFYLDGATGNAYFKGAVEATSGTFTGTVNASGGKITGNMDVTGTLVGGTIKGSKVQSTNYVAGSGGSYNKTSTGMIVDLDKGYIATPYMYTDSNGKLHATGGDFEGNITAKGGNIGGFTINDNCIFNGTASMTSTTKGAYIGTDGINMGGNCKITSSGKLTAVGADITGAITATSLRLTGSVSGLSYDDLTDKPAIPDVTMYIQKNGTIGSVSTEGATGFRVSSYGLLEARNAIIYGTIYASSGKFAGAIEASSVTANKEYSIYYDSLSTSAVFIKTSSWSIGARRLFIGVGSYDANKNGFEYGIAFDEYQMGVIINGNFVNATNSQFNVKSISASGSIDAITLSTTSNISASGNIYMKGSLVSVSGHNHNGLWNSSDSGVKMTSANNLKPSYINAPTDDNPDAVNLGTTNSTFKNLYLAGKILGATGIYNSTVSTSVNVRVSAAGDFYRSTATSSSMRFKNRISRIGFDDVKSLLDVNIYSYQYNQDFVKAENPETRYGFVLEQMEEHFPIAVEYEDGLPDSWCPQIVIPSHLLITQEHEKRINDYEKKINELTTKVTLLEEKINSLYATT